MSRLLQESIDPPQLAHTKPERDLHPGHTPPTPPPLASLHLQGKHAQSSPATCTFPCKPNKIDGRNCGKEAGRETVVSKVGSEAWASSLLPSNNNEKEKQSLNLKGAVQEEDQALEAKVDSLKSEYRLILKMCLKAQLCPSSNNASDPGSTSHSPYGLSCSRNQCFGGVFWETPPICPSCLLSAQGWTFRAAFSDVSLCVLTFPFAISIISDQGLLLMISF